MRAFEGSIGAMSVGPVASWLSERVRPEAAAWLVEALDVRTEEDLGRRWSGAGRRLGKERLVVGAEEAVALRAKGAPFVPAGWGVDECGRALLLMAALERVPAERHEDVVTALYRTGET